MARGLLTYLGLGTTAPDLRTHGVAAAARPWSPSLRVVGEALNRHDTKAALRALRDADRRALDADGWDGLLEVGDAYVRAAGASRSRKMFLLRARQSYLAALHRARRHGSLDGVLRTAGRFAELGDRESTEQCWMIAEEMADTAEARGRVRRLARRQAPAVAVSRAGV